MDLRRLGCALLAALLTASVWPVLSAGLFAAGDKRVVRSADVHPAAGWTTVADSQQWALRLEQPRGAIIESFKKGDALVTLHVGLYRDQRQGSELIGAHNRLATTLPAGWRQVERTTRTVGLADRDVTVRAALARDPNGRYVRLWQWYWLDPLWTVSDARAKIELTIDRLLLRSDTSAWIAVSTEHDPERPQHAEALLREFLIQMAPSIDSALTTTARR